MDHFIIKNKFETIKFLVKNGAILNKFDKYNTSPLQLAIEKENKEVIQFLLEKGADINAATGYKDLPINMAITR